MSWKAFVTEKFQGVNGLPIVSVAYKSDAGKTISIQYRLDGVSDPVEFLADQVARHIDILETGDILSLALATLEIDSEIKPAKKPDPVVVPPTKEALDQSAYRAQVVKLAELQRAADAGIDVSTDLTATKAAITADFKPGYEVLF